MRRVRPDINLRSSTVYSYTEEYTNIYIYCAALQIPFSDSEVKRHQIPKTNAYAICVIRERSYIVL